MSTKRNQSKLTGRRASCDRSDGKPVFEQLEQRTLLSLLGVVPDEPIVNYDATGVLSYNASTQALDCDATPLSIRLVHGGPTRPITAPRDFLMHIKVDNTGKLAGGVSGDDLVISGNLDADGNGTIDYSGVLLTGEIQQFGYYDSGTANDQYDFRFTPSGGALMSFFAGQDIGLKLASTNSTFVGSFATNFGGKAQGTVGAIEPLAPPPSLGSLAGQVFADANNNGVVDAGEAGIAGVSVALTGVDGAGNAVNLAATTGADGSYLFKDLKAGTYAIAETQPGAYLDGKDAAGSLGGVAGNDVIGQIALPAGQNGTAYNFGEVAPASLAGQVFADANNNGVTDAGEAGIANVAVRLTGVDDLGNAVNQTQQTNGAGGYLFGGLRPGTYAVAETQPGAYLDGKDAAGSLGGAAADDVLSEIVVNPGQNGEAYNFGELAPASLVGQVFADANNNGVVDAGEAGIANVAVRLTGLDDLGNAVDQTQQTNGAGGYLFAGLRPGTYAISETQPGAYLDGKDAAGSLGGTAGSDVIGQIALSAGKNGTAYNFGEITPASLSGFVWADFNDDGEIDFNEKAIQGVAVTLTGTDDRGNAVNVTEVTDADGGYAFWDLRPGTYAVVEAQPGAYQDGQESLGTAGGVVANDRFTGIGLAPGVGGLNYNFGERPLAGTGVQSGQTATIGFWNNKNGQALLKSLNGGSSATQLGNWLAATFSNMFGSLAGKTNAEVAAAYQNAFKVKSGPKLDAQAMAVAFAVYGTNSSLAGTAATRYGFAVTEYGVGVSTFNIGAGGAAFGVANNTKMAVLDILLATDLRTHNGVLYDGNTILRNLANVVYTGINETGDIS